MKSTNRPPAGSETTQRAERWSLRPCVAGMTPAAHLALGNIKKTCEEHLAGGYSLEIVDLLENPLLAAGDRIIAVPTPAGQSSRPVREVFGDLSATERVLVGLDAKPEKRSEVCRHHDRQT